MNRRRNSQAVRERITCVAEALLDLGKSLDHQLKTGSSLEELRWDVQSSQETCRLAIDFHRAEDLIKIRAIVDDWSTADIRQALAAQEAAAEPLCA